MDDAMQKTIFGYWHQGRDAAPERIRACWDLWARMNPEWELRILEWEDVSSIFSEAGIDAGRMSFNGVANIVRLAKLAEEGGVWVDAYTVPLRPLGSFLPDLMTIGFFVYHDPYRKRQSENWFIASTAGHPLICGWRDRMLAYWRIPRRPMRFRRELDPGIEGDLARFAGKALDRLQGQPSMRGAKRIMEPRKPSWAVDLARGGGGPVTPYFTLAYLFDLLLEQEPDMRALWAEMPKRTSYEALYLRHWKKRYGEMTEVDLRSLVSHTEMQKLSLPAPLPDWAMAILVEMAEANMPAAASPRPERPARADPP